MLFCLVLFKFMARSLKKAWTVAFIEQLLPDQSALSAPHFRLYIRFTHDFLSLFIKLVQCYLEQLKRPPSTKKNELLYANCSGQWPVPFESESLCSVRLEVRALHKSKRQFLKR